MTVAMPPRPSGPSTTKRPANVCGVSTPGSVSRSVALGQPCPGRAMLSHMAQGGDEHDAQPTLAPDAQDVQRTLQPDAQDALRTLAPNAPATPSPRDLRTHAEPPAQVTLLRPSQVPPPARAPSGRLTYMT